MKISIKGAGTILILFSICWSTYASQKEGQFYVQFSKGKENQLLHKLFEDEKTGFYIDVGAFDPYQNSNTLNLHLNNWRGIVTQQNPEIYAKFSHQNLQLISISMFVGKPQEFVNITRPLELQSQNLYVQAYSKETFVPTISLSQLCQRYQFKSPFVLNIAVKQNELVVLQGVNWENPQCQPDVIILKRKKSYTQQVKQATQFLMSHNYTSYQNQSGQKYPQSLIFFSRNKTQKYTNKIAVQNSKKSKYKYINYKEVLDAVRKQQNLDQNQQVYYSRQTDDLNLQVLRKQQNFYIQNVNRFNNKHYKKQNRPIVVINFCFNKSFVATNQEKYFVSTVKIQKFTFHKITIIIDLQQKLTAYILDPTLDPNSPSTLNIFSTAIRVDNLVSLYRQKDFSKGYSDEQSLIQDRKNKVQKLISVLAVVNMILLLAGVIAVFVLIRKLNALSGKQTKKYIQLDNSRGSSQN